MCDYPIACEVCGTNRGRAVSDFALETQGIRRWANFDSERRFRFLLGREWDASKPRVVFIGCNPSDADEHRDDMTAVKYVGFGQRNNFGSYVALNISPAIETDPDRAAAIDVPPDYVFKCWTEALSVGSVVVVAWGDSARRFWPHAVPGALSFLWLSGYAEVLCFGVTKAGNPRHASRLGYDTPLVPWEIGP